MNNAGTNMSLCRHMVFSFLIIRKYDVLKL